MESSLTHDEELGKLLNDCNSLKSKNSFFTINKICSSIKLTPSRDLSFSSQNFICSNEKSSNTFYINNINNSLNDNSIQNNQINVINYSYYNDIISEVSNSNSSIIILNQEKSINTDTESITTILSDKKDFDYINILQKQKYI